MAEKKSYNACKETGTIGKREEIVLNKKWRDLISKLDVSKMIDPLMATGILNSREYRDIRTEKDAGLMMSYVLESGPDGFIKFMDALRMADYYDLAADLERELQNTCTNNYSENGNLGNELLKNVAVGVANVALQRCLGTTPQPLLGISVQYRRAQVGDLAASDWNIQMSANITEGLINMGWNALNSK